MRIDHFLKISCLVKQRSIAKKLCDNHRVTVNRSEAKSSRILKVGDTVTLQFTSRVLEIRILELPEKKSISKADARNLYEIVTESRRESASDDGDFE
jgi:ribosomal 50S subunit-recycling heat shock protein